MLASTLTLDWFSGTSMSLAEQLFNLALSLNFQSAGLLAETSAVTRWLGFVGVGLQVAAGLGFVIFVHELGHFLAAKTFGVKCEKFYVGFDVPISIGPIRLPRTLGRFKWGETEYGIGIVPLGGYVKMLGQDDDPRNAEAEAQRIRQGGEADAPLDPRSYQAKPVWQRMIIISAGVVMNVIFAVFLAAAAFLYGVPYSPTIIGSSPLGSPAWQAGLQPGDHIVQMAKMTRDDPCLRFEDMGAKTAIHGMKYGDAPIPFTLERDTGRVTITAKPTKNLHPDGYYLVGISQATTSDIGDEPSKYSYLGSQKVDIKAGDHVIAVDGQALPVNKDTGKILGSSLTDQFQAKWNKPVELTIIRKPTKAANGDASTSKASQAGSDDSATGGKADGQELRVTIPAIPVKQLGIGFAMGPISAIKRGSIAEAAGVRVGDVIEEVDGQPVLDALRLPMQVAEKLGKPIEFKLRRPKSADSAKSTTNATSSKEPSKESAEATAKDDSKKDSTAAQASGEERITVTMESAGPAAFGTIGNASAQFGLENFGIAYSVLPRVSYVDPASEKASSSIQVGDELVQLQIEATQQEIKELADNDLIVTPKAEQITSMRTIVSFLSFFQHLPEGMKIRCFMKRNADIREVVLPLTYAKDWFWIQRGVPLRQLEKIQQTADVTQAMKWGATETRRRLGDVFEFLTILVSGRASARNLAGPFGIAEAAASEASNSPSRLLLFLTLLSANLAILNFLPIPALDGGHLMFLTWEAIRGKPLNEAMQVRLTMVGVLCLLGLMAFAIINDILRKVM